MSRSLDLTDDDWADGLDDRLVAELATLRTEYFEHTDATAVAVSAHTPDITSFRRHVRLAAERLPGTAKVAVHRPNESAAQQAAGSYLQIVSVDRNAEGVLVGLSSAGIAESWIHVQLHPSTSDDAVAQLEEETSRVLADVRQVVGDTDEMRRVQAAVADRLDGVAAASGDLDSEAAVAHRDAAALLRWLGDGHYTLLGYRRYTIDGSDGDRTATGVESSSLGVLRDAGQHGDGPEPVGERDLVALTQGPNPATVHRAVYPYFVSVIDADDSAEHRFVGVFTV